MNKKISFVTNSSSTSYIIENKTNEEKTIRDFIIENSYLLNEFLEVYDWYKKNKEFKLGRMLEDSAYYNYKFPPNSKVRCVFGDEDSNVLGTVYDYILRDGGVSESFIWRIDEYLR
jgi:hypothetical protein